MPKSLGISRRYFLSLAAALLAGCGGGGGSDEAPRPVSIAVYGDSTQIAPVPPSWLVSVNRPSDVAQSILGVPVKNEGVGGTDSGQLLHGDGVHPPWQQEMNSSTATIVTINHGINDHRDTLAEYRANLVELVIIAQRAGKRVVLETPNPVVVDDAPNLALRADAMRSVAADTGALLCDEYAAVEAAGLVNWQNLIDGVHPNDAMYLLKGQTLAGCLRRLL